jgi:disulfide bond formation protein DsbB
MGSILTRTGASPVFWLGVLALGLAMEGIALYFQYVLGYGPCVLCIHIRIYIAGLILVAAVALAVRKAQVGLVGCLALMLALSVGMAERSWRTLGVERGFIEGACDMNTGLPAWFALDQWFPLVFEPWEPCGYTPELLFGITMAEGLIAFSALAVLISAALLVSALRR